jgi:hypothetical protein
MVPAIQQLILAIVLNGTIPNGAVEVFNIDCLKSHLKPCGTLVIKDVNKLTDEEAEVALCRAEAAINCLKDESQTAYAITD